MYNKKPLEINVCDDERSEDLNYYDIYNEEWQRKKKSEMFNAGFHNFARTVKQYEMERQDYEAQKESDIDLSKNVEKIEIETKGLSSAQPWKETQLVEYPSTWKINSFYLGGLLIDESTLRTLLPGAGARQCH